jgi:hypothetical protein
MNPRGPIVPQPQAGIPGRHGVSAPWFHGGRPHHLHAPYNSWLTYYAARHFPQNHPLLAGYYNDLAHQYAQDPRKAPHLVHLFAHLAHANPYLPLPSARESYSPLRADYVPESALASPYPVYGGLSAGFDYRYFAPQQIYFLPPMEFTEGQTPPPYPYGMSPGLRPAPEKTDLIVFDFPPGTTLRRAAPPVSE